jgi:hypothetical protein
MDCSTVAIEVCCLHNHCANPSHHHNVPTHLASLATLSSSLPFALLIIVNMVSSLGSYRWEEYSVSINYYWHRKNGCNGDPVWSGLAKWRGATGEVTPKVPNLVILDREPPINRLTRSDSSLNKIAQFHLGSSIRPQARNLLYLGRYRRLGGNKRSALFDTVLHAIVIGAAATRLDIRTGLW